MDEKWGFGCGEEKAFDFSQMDDGTPFSIVWGEHPHSRSDNRMYARFTDGKIESFDGHRVLVRVELRSYNYLKCSGLSGNEVRKGGQYRLYFGERMVWGQFFRDPVWGLRHAANTIEKLFDSEPRLWESAEPKVGRKIYWMNHPAVITGFDCDENEGGGNRLYLKSAEGTFPRAPWHEDDTDSAVTVITDTLSPHIWWWRK